MAPLFRRPARWLSALAVLVLWLALLELGLRLSGWPALETMRQMARLFRHDRELLVAMRPETSVHLRLDAPVMPRMVNFLATTDARGLRVGDRDEAAASEPANATVLHCVGDSFTMGWNVAWEDSYPARLQQLLREGGEAGARVLNLGVPGHGAVAALAHSRRLAAGRSPGAVLYLFHRNDLDDDPKTEAARGKSSLWHAGRWLFGELRPWLALANVHHALLGRAVGRAGKAGEGDCREQAEAPLTIAPAAPPLLRATSVEPGRGEAAEEPLASTPTARAVAAYAREAAAANTIFLAMVIDDPADDRPRRMAAIFAAAGARTLLLDAPPALRLRCEGHFTRRGNAELAALAARELAAPRTDATDRLPVPR